MLLLHTESLPHYSLEHIFSFAKKANYDGIELSINTNFDTQNFEYLKLLESRYNIPIKAFTIITKKEEILTIPFQNTVREFPETVINLISPKLFSYKYKKWLETLVPKLAKKYNLLFCRRNISLQTFLGFIPQYTDNSLFILKEKGMVCLDLSALASTNEEIMKNISFLGNKLGHIYLSNVMRHIPYSLPQKGILPIESFLTKLAHTRYKYNFSLLVDPTVLYEGDDKKVLEKLIESREFFEKYFTKEIN